MMILFSTNKGYRFVKTYLLTYNGIRGNIDEISSNVYINSFTAIANRENGVIRLTSSLSSSESFYAAGVWEYSRAIYEGENKPLNWQLVTKKNWRSSTEDNKFIYDDSTVESGVLYKYRVSFYSYTLPTGVDSTTRIKKYAYGDSSSSRWKTASDLSSVCFEDILLGNKDTLLKK